MELNPQHTVQLVKLLNASPYFQLLAITIEDITLGRAWGKTTLDTRHLSPYGAIHGGAYASLVDTAAYWSVYGELPEDAGLITLDVNVHFLSSVKSGEVTIIGEQIKSGSTLCLARGSIIADNGKVLAYGTSKLLVTKGLQTIADIARAANITLPSKFI
jgi:uncharacterized protein (TIGR00369 family)